MGYGFRWPSLLSNPIIEWYDGGLITHETANATAQHLYRINATRRVYNRVLLGNKVRYNDLECSMALYSPV